MNTKISNQMVQIDKVEKSMRKILTIINQGIYFENKLRYLHLYKKIHDIKLDKVFYNNYEKYLVIFRSMKKYFSYIYLDQTSKKKIQRLEYKAVKIENKKYIIAKCNIKCKPLENDNKSKTSLKKNTEKRSFIIDHRYKKFVVYQNWRIKKHDKEEYISLKIPYLQKKGYSIMLHNLIMNRLLFRGAGQPESVDHINMIPRDNRKENLRILSASQQITNQRRKNEKKNYPKDSMVKLEDIPKNVMYRNMGKEESFRIEFKNFPDVGKLSWETPKSYLFPTTKIPISIQYKFEEVKKYMLWIKKQYPIQFNKLNIEYNYNKQCQKLINSFNSILKESGFDDYKDHQYEMINKDKNYLEERTDYLDNKEKKLLKEFDPLRKFAESKDNSYPLESGLQKYMVPSDISYLSEKEPDENSPKNYQPERFKIGAHPSHLKKTDGKPGIKYGTTAKSKSTLEKFNEIIEEQLILNKQLFDYNKKNPKNPKPYEYEFLTKTSHITKNMIPRKYVTYQELQNTKIQFRIENHPNQKNDEIWKSSKNKSVGDSYKSMLNELIRLNKIKKGNIVKKRTYPKIDMQTLNYNEYMTNIFYNELSNLKRIKSCHLK